MGSDIHVVYTIFGIVLDYTLINKGDKTKLRRLEKKNAYQELAVFKLNEYDASEYHHRYFLGYKHEMDEKTEITSGLFTMPNISSITHNNRDENEFLVYISKVCNTSPQWYIFQETTTTYDD